MNRPTQPTNPEQTMFMHYIRDIEREDGNDPESIAQVTIRMDVATANAIRDAIGFGRLAIEISADTVIFRRIAARE
jgi:hypothetical protein